MHHHLLVIPLTLEGRLNGGVKTASRKTLRVGQQQHIQAPLEAARSHFLLPQGGVLRDVDPPWI